MSRISINYNQKKNIPWWLLKKLNPIQQQEVIVLLKKGENIGAISQKFGIVHPSSVGRKKPPVFTTKTHKLSLLQDLAKKMGKSPSITEFRDNVKEISVGAITWEFGTWNNALKAAGLPINKSLKILTLKERFNKVPTRKEVIFLLQKYGDTHLVAQKLGLQQSTVYSIKKEEDIDLKKKYFTKEEIEKISRLFNEGKSTVEIGKIMKRNQATISYIRKKYNLKLNWKFYSPDKKRELAELMRKNGSIKETMRQTGVGYGTLQAISKKENIPLTNKNLLKR